MQYETFKEVPDAYVVDALAYKTLAREKGQLRYEDSIKWAVADKPGFGTKDPVKESKSILAEIGAALFCNVDPESLCLFEPRNDQGYLSDARNPDVGRVEVRRNPDNMPFKPLRAYGKDYFAGAVLLQTCLEVVDGITTGKVYLLGWNDAVADWGTTPPTRRQYSSLKTLWQHKRRDMDTFDVSWGVAA